MLALTRSKDDEVILSIDETTVTVKVLGFSRGKVKLGFVAPPAVRIFRPDAPTLPPSSKPRTRERRTKRKRRPAA